MQYSMRNPVMMSLVSVLTAVCLAIQLSPRPPNVEFTSLFAFVFGFLFGSVGGVLFGGFVMFVNGFFSPWGFAGLNLPFQIVGMAAVGFAGAVYRRYVHNHISARFYLEVAVLGAFLTVLYDLVTNFGVALSFMIVGTPPSVALITALAYGTPFSMIHLVSNVFVFGIIFFPLTKALNNIMMVRNLG